MFVLYFSILTVIGCVMHDTTYSFSSTFKIAYSTDSTVIFFCFFSCWIVLMYPQKWATSWITCHLQITFCFLMLHSCLLFILLWLSLRSCCFFKLPVHQIYYSFVYVFLVNITVVASPLSQYSLSCIRCRLQTCPFQGGFSRYLFESIPLSFWLLLSFWIRHSLAQLNDLCRRAGWDEPTSPAQPA